MKLTHCDLSVFSNFLFSISASMSVVFVHSICKWDHISTETPWNILSLSELKILGMYCVLALAQCKSMSLHISCRPCKIWGFLLIHKCTFFCIQYLVVDTVHVLILVTHTFPSHPSLSHSPATKHHSIPELGQQHSQSTGPKCGGYKQHWNNSSSWTHPGHPVERSRATRELSCQLDSCRHSLQLHHHPGGRLQHWYKSTNGFHWILTLWNCRHTNEQRSECCWSKYAHW